MSFISVSFIVFLAVTVLIYYIIPKKYAWCALLAASFVFYMYGGGYKTVLYLIFTAAVTFFAGIFLEKLNEKKSLIPKSDKKSHEETVKKKKAIVAAVCAVLFGMLYVLKYLDFTVNVAVSLLKACGITAEVSVPSLIIPLGVSFYIFQSIGYTVDCYRGKYKAQRNFLKYLLFVSFFPQIVQGPISRYDQLECQLTSPSELDTDNIRDGIQRMLWGYFKKMVIADRAAVVVSAFFGSYDSYGGAVAAFSVLMYCINLYCDFSGGIDISIGAAKLFGITMEENFKRPIFALSLAEYWRRWHITLGGWMRDYVFYPLSLSKSFGKLGKWSRNKIGGKFGKILPTTVATFIIYLIIGIWHGANFRYIAYGFYNGAIITSSVLFAGIYSSIKKKLKINADSHGWKAFSMLRTALIVFIGRYITRSPRLIVAGQLILKTFTPSEVCFNELWNGTLTNMGITVSDYIVIGVSVLFLLAVEFYEEKCGKNVISVINEKKGAVQFIVLLTSLIVILIFGIMRGSYISSEFIYKQY
jgi:alginate O-acetyltransferase complex protein AlgI